MGDWWQGWENWQGFERRKKPWRKRLGLERNDNKGKVLNEGKRGED